MDWEMLGITTVQCHNTHKKRIMTFEHLPLYIKCVNDIVFLALRINDNYYLLNESKGLESQYGGCEDFLTSFVTYCDNMVYYVPNPRVVESHPSFLK